MQGYEKLNKSFINGEWVEGLSERTFEVSNPYDDSIIAPVRLATKQQLQEAFDTAKEAQKKWAKTTAQERKDVLQKVIDYFQDNREAIVDVLVQDTGGTVLKANVEFGLTLEFLEEAMNMPGEIGQIKEVPSPIEGKVNHIHRLPLGVITSISPFNFPMNLSMRTIAPAIALGNSVVHKPDIQVGFAGGSVIAKAFEHAGLPKGVLNMIMTDIQEIGDDILTNENSELISFTGSTPVGRHIGEIAGRMLKRVALELGGNSPFVVMSDADVDRAVEGAVFGKFTHQGQICMIINRIIVHQDKYDEFVQKFVERAKGLTAGDPSDPETVIGPLINQKQMDRALNTIEQAKKDGAKVALEGERRGNVLTPYVFVDVDNSSKLAQTELFAPIAPIIKAETDEHAIELANETEHGLSSAIYTSDVQKGEEYALQVESGMTHVNDQTINDSPIIPFGGNKASGIGRFGNPWVVEEFTVTKWVSVQNQYRQYPF